MNQRKKFLWLVGIFLFAYFMPLGNPVVSKAILEAFNLLQWYAINHTLGCVVPAMFIAGAIATFLNKQSVMAYLGPNAPKPLAFIVASLSGVVLAVCSCSVLPMFAGIYHMGAGLGPASAFLYSGPAINVMAIFLSARVLGLELGVARTISAISFAFVIGIIMAWIFNRSESDRVKKSSFALETEKPKRPLWKTASYFTAMILFLVFSDWYSTNDVTIQTTNGKMIHANIRYETSTYIDYQEYGPDGRLSHNVVRIGKEDVNSIIPEDSWIQDIHNIRYFIAGFFGLLVLLMVFKWFTREEIREWMHATWDYALMIVPLLFGGIFVTGFIGALIPEHIISSYVGGNAITSNFVAAFIGMIWYFATLTEIPIVEMLTRLGMGQGPALSLLLAGPALSLPSILVIYKVIGLRKTAVFCVLTVVMSTIVGFLFGILFQ